MNRIVILSILLVATKVMANPIAINEAREELGRIQQIRKEAKLTLDKAKLAYKHLSQAEHSQCRALNNLIKADKAKQKAQKSSVTSVEDTGSPYYADMSHGFGSATIVR